MKVVSIICSIMFAFFLVTSCSTNTNNFVKSRKVSSERISNKKWYLVNNSGTVKGLYSKEISLTIDEVNSTASGFSGCNYFNAKISKYNNGAISFTNISETKMYCPSIKEEEAFLSILKNVDRYEVNNDKLNLFKGNILLITFKTI